MVDRAEIEQLVSDYAPLARKVAGRWALQYPWLDQSFLSACMVAVWDVARKFGRGANNFATLAHKNMLWACIRVLHNERRHNKEAFRRAGPLVNADGGTVEAVAVLADDGAPVGSDTEARDLAGELLRYLRPERARRLIRYLVDGATVAEIGTEDGISGERVGQTIAADLARLAKLAGADLAV